MNLFRALIGGVKEVSCQKYQRKYDGVEHVLLDVRSPQEFESEHIPGAINIPLKKLSKKLKSLPDSQPVVCVSRNGERGREAAYILQDAGYNVEYLVGGILRWRQDGGEVVHN